MKRLFISLVIMCAVCACSKNNSGQASEGSKPDATYDQESERQTEITENNVNAGTSVSTSSNNIVEEFCPDARYVGTEQEDDGNKNQYYVYTDYTYDYKVVFGDNYIRHIELREDAKDSGRRYLNENTAQEMISEVLQISGSLETVIHNDGYWHYKEVQNGIDTGSYAIFLTDADGLLTKAVFYQGTNYNVNENNLISEEEAYEISVKAINEKYIVGRSLELEISQQFDDAVITLKTIKDELCYNVELSAHMDEDETDFYYFSVDINAYTGECKTVASNID